MLSFADYQTGKPDGSLHDRYAAYWPLLQRFVSGRQGMLPLGAAGFSLLYGENPVCTSTVLARRDAVLAVGGFDAGLRQAEDWDLWIRLALHGPVAASTRHEAVHADREDSLSRRVAERVASVRTVVRRYRPVALRRAPGAALSACVCLAQAMAEGAQHEGRLARAALHSLAAAICRPFSLPLARQAAGAALLAAGYRR